MNDSDTYIVAEKYIETHDDEDIMIHLFFPDFFMFVPNKNTNELCWVLDDKETPELTFINMQGLP